MKEYYLARKDTEGRGKELGINVSPLNKLIRTLFLKSPYSSLLVKLDNMDLYYYSRKNSISGAPYFNAERMTLFFKESTLLFEKQKS